MQQAGLGHGLQEGNSPLSPSLCQSPGRCPPAAYPSPCVESPLPPARSRLRALLHPSVQEVISHLAERGPPRPHPQNTAAHSGAGLQAAQVLSWGAAPVLPPPPTLSPCLQEALSRALHRP